MPSLKDLRNRINSVKSTQKITAAMKMVAAAKLRRAQQGAEAGRPYATRMADVVASIASGVTVSPQSPKLLARGARLTELLKQPQYQPMPVEEQVASIYAGTQGFLDKVETRDVTRYEAAMLSYLRAEHKGILKTIRDSKQLEDDTAKKLKDALTKFGKQFA